MKQKNDPNRKEKFIQAAEELFSEKGYDNTTIEDITKKVKIAKGGFYYYFKSKKEVLNAIHNIRIDRFINMLERYVNDDIYTPREKLETIFTYELPEGYAQEYELPFFRFYSYLGEDFVYLVQDLTYRVVKKTAPTLLKVYEEGRQKGDFKDIVNPLQTIELLIMMIWQTDLLTTEVFTKRGTKESAYEYRKPTAMIIERVLGLEEGSINPEVNERKS